MIGIYYEDEWETEKLQRAANFFLKFYLSLLFVREKY